MIEKKAKTTKKGESPTQRTLRRLRGQGYDACVVERKIETPERKGDPRPRWMRKVTIDAFNFADVLAYDTDPYGEQAALLVQTTSGSNLATRREKVLAEPRALGWLLAGNHIALHGWVKRQVPTKAGGTRARWECIEEAVTVDDFAHHARQQRFNRSRPRVKPSHRPLTIRGRKRRKPRMRWSLEEAQRLQEQHGIEAEKYLIRAVVRRMTK